MPLPLEIRETKLLLVEGRDEEEFFRAFHQHLGIAGVQVLNYEGKTNLSDRLASLVLIPGFGRVVKLAITRDADESEKSAFQSIGYALKNCQQACPKALKRFTEGPPPQVGVFILPGGAEQGMLEDLCLRSVANHPVMACVDDFMQCLERNSRKPASEQQGQSAPTCFPKNPSKARVLAFLAGMHEPDGRLGIAAQRGYWNFDHPSLQDLRQFLEHFRD